jgi:2-polyprenyl-6-methoxyphenol hydroxylase-like FAD-dependent oxidoreductase
MRVAIVGGGIGGMALALSLRDAGIEDVEVYESTSTVKRRQSANRGSSARR